MSIFLMSLIKHCDEENNTIKMRGVATKKKTQMVYKETCFANSQSKYHNV